MSRTDYLLAVMLLVVFGAYRIGFGGPLLFDDFAALSVNPSLQIDGGTFDEWRTAALSSNSGPLRRPIAMFSFALNAVAAGEISPYAIKLVNTLLHCLIGVFVYLLAQLLFARLYPQRGVASARWLALLSAAIWLLHPLQVSTVLYAVQRMAQLSTLFMVVGLWVFVRYRSRFAERGGDVGEVLAVLLWLALCTLFAAYSKENGALLPVLALVVEVCFFRGEWGGRRHASLRLAGVAALAAFFAVLLLCMVLAPDFLSERFARREFSLHERVLTQARMLWHYLAWLTLPDVSAMGFQHDDIPVSRSLTQPLGTLLAIIAWIVAAAVAVTLRERYPLLLFALLFFLVGHSVESTVWPLEMVYEHRNYAPVIGFCMLFASLLAQPFFGTGNARALATPLVGLVLVVLLALLLVRVDSWSEELRMAGVNVRNHPESSRSNYFYANALLQRYRNAQALGLDEEQAREALLAARYYFEQMYDTNPRDVAALVMLHSLDTQFAADAPARRDWLAELETLLQTRELQASDRNALGELIGCVNAGGCTADETRILGLLEQLEARYPENLTVLGYRFTYLLGSGASPEALQQVIDRALALRPGRREFLVRQIELQAAANDVDGMYESVRQWLLYDKRRLRLHTLQALFIPADSGRES
ncbi:MAG: hypothetical protein KDI09_14575 [Halioglobus sp.]|nr:hypothetical protein [Halioglobus sp.]